MKTSNEGNKKKKNFLSKVKHNIERLDPVFQFTD